MPVLPTAFISRQGSRVSRDGGSLVIEHPEAPTVRLPLGQLGAVVALGGIEFTTAALVGLAERGLGCALASRDGRLRAIVTLPTGRQQTMHRLQHRLEGGPAPRCDTPDIRLDIARSIIHAKLDAQLGVLSQHQRTHGELDLSQPIASIRRVAEHARRASSTDQLRGFEGAATARYFAAMPALCRTELTTSSRSRRPPLDPFNAALSFGYSLLTNEVTTILYARGLDPGIGVLHASMDGRPSLSLDLMEPLRHAVIDRLVLRAANRRELTLDDFEECTTVESPEEPSVQPHDDATEQHADSTEPGQSRRGIRFTDSGRARFLRLYRDMMGVPVGAGESTGRRETRGLLSEVVEEFERTLLAVQRGDAVQNQD